MISVLVNFMKDVTFISVTIITVTMFINMALAASAAVGAAVDLPRGIYYGIVEFM